MQHLGSRIPARLNSGIEKMEGRDWKAPVCDQFKGDLGESTAKWNYNIIMKRVCAPFMSRVGPCL